jgi:hypothetical protein
MASKSSTARTAPPSAGEPASASSARAQSLIHRMAARYSVDADKLMGTLKGTVFRGIKQKDGSYRDATNEELMSLLLVADAYQLNPFTREIYAFPDEKRGGIIPVVSIDGWLRIINTHPSMKSLRIEYVGFDVPKDDPGHDPYIEVTITRSDRDDPTVIREYMAECWRDTGPWNSHPRRMLRWKAIIQCGRVAFGFGGIYDPDEAERIRDSLAIEGQVVERTMKPLTQAPRAIEQQASPSPLAGVSPVTAEIDEAELARMRAADAELMETEAGARG